MGRLGLPSALPLNFRIMKELKRQLFERFNEDYNVLSENDNRVIITFDYSDICVLVSKEKKKLYFLVPLTKAHKFDYHPDSLHVDGKLIHSDMFCIEYSNQVIEYQGDVPNPLKDEIINKIYVNFIK